MQIKLPNFETARVLVIGDIMLDRYWFGNTSRISPEAPVPVVHIKETEDRPGGASNVALNVTALGGNAVLLGLAGKDEQAEILQENLQQAKVKCYFQKVSKAPTINKLRVISHNQQLIRLDFEENFHDTDIKQLLTDYNKQLAIANIVIISDYGKGIAKHIPEFIQKAKALNVPVLVDPKGLDFGIYRDATLITPNFSELTAIVGVCKNEKDIEAKGIKLIRDNGLEAVLVTRGAKGMSLIQANGDALHIPTQAREVYDVTGAGDTVIAALGTALAAGENLTNAVMLSNAAAGIVVKKLGAATASEAEIRRTLQRQQESWLGIVNEERLLQEVADAKAHGEKIVMTNGCFDILHAGHIAYLEQAKSLGKRLIVAVNDDASVQRLKGNDRPVNSLAQRMAVLAGLRSVDWIVPFSEDTPERLIKAVTPNVLVKGGDYKADEIAGAPHVIKNGGEVKVLAYIPDSSSSLIIDRIKKTEKT